MQPMMKNTHEQLRQLNKDQLIAIILELRGMVEDQSARIRALENQLAKNSTNSSKPPSSDGLKKKPASLREKSLRPSGGQEGHQGNTLEMTVTPDEIVLYTPESCGHCGTILTDVPVSAVEKRQVFDIPPVRIQVTEHQAVTKCCPQCQKPVKATFPTNVKQPVQYGERIQAQAVYLNTYQLLPLARACELFGDLYGHTPSEALILQASERLHDHLAEPLAQIRDGILQADVVNCDETGLRVEGKLNWLHVAATEQLTWYGVHAKRGQEALRDLDIVPNLRGCAVHDCFSSYFLFDQLTHALCNAHHLRDLKFVHERYNQKWAQDLAQLLRAGKAEVADTASKARGLARKRLRYYHQEYDRILQAGWADNPPLDLPLIVKPGRKPKTSPQNLLTRLENYKTFTLRYLTDFRVPFDNNLAERDLRMMKVRQKISGTFRTRHGAELFCDIRSYISTVRKQEQNVLNSLYDAFLGQPFIPVIPA